MSQVKKLQNGGYPELIGVKKPEFQPIPELKFNSSSETSNGAHGSFTIDGKTYEATPEFIQAFSQYLNKYGDSSSPLAGLTTALQNGENITYDSVGNTILGMNGKWTGVDDRANSRRNVGASD